MTKEVQIRHKPDGKFEVSHGGKKGTSEQDYPVIDFPEKTGPELIVFQLSPGPDKFNQNDPIWVSASAKPGNKPTNPANTDLVDAYVLQGGKTLVVINKNATKGTLHYNLNMTDGNAQSLQLDPVITNGGGGGGQGMNFLSSTQAVVIGLAVALALVLLGAWIGRMMGKRN